MDSRQGRNVVRWKSRTGYALAVLPTQFHPKPGFGSWSCQKVTSTAGFSVDADGVERDLEICALFSIRSAGHKVEARVAIRCLIFSPNSSALMSSVFSFP